ncbi:hypothetical protein [Riemerella columbipharyngis]|uniref:Lipoprotein n=1 Tax=Riemerella columbipharyngis TaxID=1071918 RepID=A0A1G6Y8E6_9FLAO|nr:hypothetical protein [Riemerella columbipharyngis]SDD86699.1 hypothetical protein SAMN05421544_10170 [Riemerella columbipharyngis]
MKNILHTIILCVLIFPLILGCNQRSKDFPDENYNSLFPNKGKIDTPDVDYTDMTSMPCDPKEDDINYKYPGVDISENVRTYTVTLKYQFSEEQVNTLGGSDNRSQFDLKYIDENKKLVTLRSYSDDEGHKQTIENKKQYETTFKVKSGYPLYLSVYGAGYDIFKIKASIQAKSDDGIVVSPVIKYENSFYTDGFSDDFSYCEKIILP